LVQIRLSKGTPKGKKKSINSQKARTGGIYKCRKKKREVQKEKTQSTLIQKLYAWGLGQKKRKLAASLTPMRGSGKAERGELLGSDGGRGGA